MPFQSPPPDDQRCTATCTGYKHPERGREGQRCERYRVTGLTVCRVHGGGTTQAVEAGRRRAAAEQMEQRARKIMETYGRKIETTAVEALLDEVKWTAGHVAWLRERVAELETRELEWNTIRVKEGGDDRGVTEEATPSVWIKLYQTERAHLVKVCTAAISAGIEERRVRLVEAQGKLVADAIRNILLDLNLSEEQQGQAYTIVRRHLRALSAG